jgi:hypothetical protein
MTRTYPIPSSMTPEQASHTVQGILEPFGFNLVAPINEAITVVAKPEVFEVAEGAIRFLLHEPKGCTCAPCQYRAEVMR